ncbi:MAG: isomerizing glutamine--fructose-6-phosphate transaminase, partial [Halofilum sp. (in: g-proteobacteria)]
IDAEGRLQRRREVGRVESLSAALESDPVAGRTGVAHTRWATHGVPHERNAHPHLSGTNLALVHNGIIENHAALRRELEGAEYRFTSDTDSEVVAHRVHQHLAQCGNLFDAVHRTVAELDGAYALCVTSPADPDRLITARRGCPVVIGVGIGEHFVASDVAALLPITRRFIFLEEGDIAEVSRTGVRIVDVNGASVERSVHESDLTADAVERGAYRHYMQKEIFEQPRAVADTLTDRIGNRGVLDAAFGYRAGELFPRVQHVHMVACGTSYHAALVARYGIERLAGIPVNVEIASEYRYRRPVVPPNTLFVSISQSGETADTLAAQREARKLGYAGSLALASLGLTARWA